MKENILITKTKQFALDIIVLYKKLVAEQEFVISKQLLRSGTSIGANVREAVSAQSKKDFYAKICIAYKEANEALYWLELLEEGKLTQHDTKELQGKCIEIIKILAKTKLTTEENMQFDKK